MKRKINSLFSERRLILDSSMVFSASFIGAIFMFASSVALSRIFSPEIFGNYKTLVNLFLFIPALLDFGASPTLTRYIAGFMAKKEEGKINRMIRFFLKIKGISVLSVSLMIYLSRDAFAGTFLKDSSLSYLIVPGLLLSVSFLFDLTKPVISGLQDFRLLSFSNFLTTACIGIFSIVLGYYYGVYYALLGWSLAYFAGNLPNIYHISKRRLFSKNSLSLDIGPIFRSYALPMQMMMILNTSSLAVIPVLSLFFAQKLIGYYGFAWTFYSGIMLVPITFSQVLFPKVSELKANNKATRSSIVSILAVYTLIVLTGVTAIHLFSPEIISLVSAAYLPGLHIFRWLNIAGLLLGYLFIYANYLSAKGSIRSASIVFFVMNMALFAVSFALLFSWA
ncbi:MAG: oligosaccharide flippase family protein [archaeon]